MEQSRSQKFHAIVKEDFMRKIFFSFLFIALFISVQVAFGDTNVSEPTTMLLLGSGLIGLAGYGRKKFFKQ
jgi:hypothetical protein